MNTSSIEIAASGLTEEEFVEVVRETESRKDHLPMAKHVKKQDRPDSPPTPPAPKQPQPPVKPQGDIDQPGDKPSVNPPPPQNP